MAHHAAQGANPDWEFYKDKILRLYLDKRLPLRAVKTIMDDNHNFGASARMYKTRLHQWGVHKRQKLSKNSAVNRDGSREKQTASRLSNACSCARPDSSKPACRTKSTWRRSEPSISLQRPELAFARSDSSLGSSDPDDSASYPSLDAEEEPSATTHPATSTGLAVKCIPPHKQLHSGKETHENTSLLESLRHITHSTRDASTTRGRTASSKFSRIASELDSVAGALCSPSSSTEDLKHNVNAWEFITPNLSPTSMTTSHSQSTQPSAMTPSEGSSQTEDAFSFDQIGKNDALIVATVPRPQTDASSEIHKDLDLSSKWLSRAFLACVLTSRNKVEAAEYALDQAKSLFRTMARINDAQILMAQLILLGILHSHGQSKLAGTLLEQARNLVRQAYDLADPIVTVTTWCHAIHDQSLSNTPIRSHELDDAHTALSARYGPASPNALAALYALSFTQLSDQRLDEGARNLHVLRNLATSVLGATHLVTIASLTAHARVLHELGQISPAINLMLDAGRRFEVALGRNHPLRLDQQRRLAAMYKDEGGKEGQIEEIYREVLKGRISALGCNHPYTSGSYTELIEFLRLKGKMDDAEKIGRNYEHMRIDGQYSVEFLESY